MEEIGGWYYECNRYTAVLTFILGHLAVRGLSLVNGYCCIKIKTKNKNRSFQPFVLVIVPTYNEAKVIAKRIENWVVLDYPKSQI